MKKVLMLLAVACVAFAACASRVDTLAITTKNVPGAPMNVVVIVPDAALAGTPCPTVYLLNGHGGNHTSWHNCQPRLSEFADLYGMLMVMPDGRNSWYWDAPKNPEMKMETFIISELIPYIDSHYPTIPEASKRAVTGLSMGGQGAMYLAIRHPEIFGNAGSTSGGVDIRPFPERWGMKNWLGDEEENRGVWEEFAVVNMVPQINPGTLNIIFDCGVDDFFADVNNAFHQELIKAKIPHDYISRPGAHTGDYWKNSILYHLVFFNEAFRK